MHNPSIRSSTAYSMQLEPPNISADERRRRSCRPCDDRLSRKFREMVANIVAWNRHFERHPELIFNGRYGEDIERAAREGRTAIFFGLQNPSPIEDDIGLIEVCHTLGVRFMQLSYNNQALLATGCFEAEDPGITRFGRQAIREMNRVGMVMDMSHSAERSTLDAIEASTRPIAITHANPMWWHQGRRSKSRHGAEGVDRVGGHVGPVPLFPSPERRFILQP